FVVLVLLVPRTLSSSLRLPYTTLFRSETGGPTGINTTTCDPRPGPPVAEHHPPDDRVSCDSAQCPGTPHASERSSMPSTPTIIIAPDSYKGTATAGQAATWLAEGVREVLADAVISQAEETEYTSAWVTFANVEKS